MTINIQSHLLNTNPVWVMRCSPAHFRSLYRPSVNDACCCLGILIVPPGRLQWNPSAVRSYRAQDRYFSCTQTVSSLVLQHSGWTGLKYSCSTWAAAEHMYSDLPAIFSDYIKLFPVLSPICISENRHQGIKTARQSSDTFSELKVLTTALVSSVWGLCTRTRGSVAFSPYSSS